MVCENFKCNSNWKNCGRPPGCEKFCLFALDIYKCGICQNKESCEGSDLWNKIAEERKVQLSKNKRC